MKLGERLAQRFTLLEEAAAGGMGTIYRARDEVGGEVVAVKVMAGVPGAADHERFLREAAILARLSHPAIVRYVAHGATPAGEPYLVMPFLVGEALDERLARRGLDVDETLEATRRAAEALAVAHASGVVHRDIKPSNLFLVGGDPRQLVVLDFGVARLSRATLLTATGALVGTVGYMAPEQASGDPEVSPAADVFALGCVLYECLSGRQAFGGATPIAALAALLLQEPAPLDEPQVDDRLAALVRRMLDKDPLRRPPDGAALARELATLGPLVARASTLQPRIGAMTGQERRLVSVVLAEESAESDARTQSTGEVALTVERLRGELSRHGAQLAPLGAGSYLVTLTSRGAATDQAARAAACALALQGALGSARIAVATGQAERVGNGTAGPVVERASLLVRAARTGELRVDAPTAALLEGRFLLEADTSGAARLVGERSDALAEGPGKRLPHAGRDKELALLDATLAEAVSEEIVRAVVVGGEAGIGKSRLCLELRRRPAGQAARWISARADSSSAGAPLDVARKLLRATAQRRELDAAALSEHFAELGVPAARRPYLLELAGLVSAPSAEVRAVLADPAAARVQLGEAFAAWLAAIARVGPLVLHIEDIHWVDPASLAMLESAALALRGAALLLLATSRPDPFVEGTWRALEAQTIRLASLTPRAARKLVRDAAEGASEGEVDAIVERARGNPFFLEELLRWRALGHGDEPPETLLAVVQARIDALEGDARRVLRAAAILDGAFRATDVAALLGGAREEPWVASWIATLEDRQLLARDGPLHRFEHALLRDACYATLTEADERTGHRLAADWLSRQAGTDPLVVAHHLVRAAQEHEAEPWLRRAAFDALRAGDLHGVLGVADRGAKAGATGEPFGELLVAEVNALGWLGRIEEMVPRAEQALALLPVGSTLWWGAAASLLFAGANLGRPELGAPVVAAVLELTEDTPPSGYYGRAIYVLAAGLLLHGQRDVHAVLLARAMRVLPCDDPVFELYVTTTRANHALFSEGDAPSALAFIDAAVALLGRAGDPFAAANVTLMHSRILHESGDVEGAVERGRAAAVEARRAGADYLLDWSHMMIGSALLDSDDPGAAEAELAAIDTPQVIVKAFVLLNRALVCLTREDVPALEAACAALDVTAALPLLHGSALVIRSELARRRGRHDDALRIADEAIALQARAGALPRERRAAGLARAEALLALGRAGEAEITLRALVATHEAQVARLPEALRETARRRAPLADRLAALYSSTTRKSVPP